MDSAAGGVVLVHDGMHDHRQRAWACDLGG